MATYDKALKTVTITTKSGGTFTVADTATDGKGSAVWGLITDGHDVLYAVNANEWQYIAHDCICSANCTIATTTVTKPADKFCEDIEICP